LLAELFAHICEIGSPEVVAQLTMDRAFSLDCLLNMLPGVLPHADMNRAFGASKL
jgi:hypothetical protein